MVLKVKTTELLQAQSASFLEGEISQYDHYEGNYKVEYGKRMKRALGMYGNIASMVFEYSETDDTLNPAQDDYTAHLKTLGNLDRSALRVEAGIFEAYSEFSESIEILKNNIEAGSAVSVGGGMHSKVFLLEKDNKKYAVRLIGTPKDRERMPSQRILHGHVNAAARSQDVDGNFEKIVAASFEQAITISEYIDALSTDALSPDQIALIADVHLDKLLDQRLKASARGIHFDATPKNILYDPDVGFTDIDFSSNDYAIRKEEPYDLKTALMSLLTSFGLHAAIHLEKDRDEESRLKLVNAAYLARLSEYIQSKVDYKEYVDIRKKYARSIVMENHEYIRSDNPAFSL